jgi:NAD(P)-dependent dehydrogenase (short-subunit alcohol dehydrogenase family)
MAARKGDGQTALITGASTGIGVDLAECFAEDGYDVILAARTESTLREVAIDWRKAHHVKATAIAVDLAAIGGGARLAEEIKKKGLYGRRAGEQRRLRLRRRLQRIGSRNAARHDRSQRPRARRAHTHLLAGHAGQEARRAS